MNFDIAKAAFKNNGLATGHLMKEGLEKPEKFIELVKVALENNADAIQYVIEYIKNFRDFKSLLELAVTCKGSSSRYFVNNIADYNEFMKFTAKIAVDNDASAIEFFTKIPLPLRNMIKNNLPLTLRILRKQLLIKMALYISYTR